MTHHPTSTLLTTGLVLAVFAATTSSFASDATATEPGASSATQPAQPTGTDPTDLLAARRGALNAVDQALRDASAGGTALFERADTSLNFRQILDPDRHVNGSMSVGTIVDGSLEDAAELDHVGAHYEVLETHRRRNTNWGTEELIDAIERAARQVGQQHGGAPLQIGNLGYRDGGPIPWSRSHQAGRDADIAFYSLDQQGRSVPTPGLIEFDDEGRALNQPLYFDVPRNWSLVRALLTDPDINVQWLFVSEGLKTLMLEHALDIDEPRRLIERAAQVLHQPTNAPPHADHLHLRIGCSETDRLEGCVDWGPRWEWYDWHEDAMFVRTHEVQRAFEHGDAPLRQRALEYLHDIQAPFGPELALDRGLRDPDSDVRATAYDVLDDLPVDSPFGIRALADALDGAGELTADRRRTLYGALGRANHADAADVAVEQLADTSLPDDERQLALNALRHRMKPRLVPELTELMRSEQSASLREDIAVQLRRITARNGDLDWSSPLGDDHEQMLENWEKWSHNAHDDRRERLVEMLSDHGVDHWEDLEAVDDLLPLLREAEDYKRYNLNLVLSEWTGRWVSPGLGESAGAYDFWSNWWDRNRDRQLDDTDHPWE